MALTVRSDSAQGARGVTLSSGARGLDRWWLWADSSRGGVGSDLASWSALSSGPGPFSLVLLFTSVPNKFQSSDFKNTNHFLS
jgi:hypothetical protein